MRAVLLLSLAISTSLAVACGGTGNPLDVGTSAGGSGSTSQGGAAGEGGEEGGAAGAAGSITLNPQGGSSSTNNCVDAPGGDDDHDGWTAEEGDCNDCNPGMNPGALDVVNCEGDDCATGKPLAEQIDEDCDGTPRMPADDTSCDGDLGGNPAVADAFDAARAAGLCNVKIVENPADKKERKWGVLDAKFVQLGAGFLAGQSAPIFPGDFGALTALGPAKPQEGKVMLGLSTATARAPGQPGFASLCGPLDGTKGGSLLGVPAAFPNPKDKWPKQGSCGTTGAPYDAAVLDLKLRVPTNAKQMGLRFRFYTCEFPQYVCQEYNDVFAVMVLPIGGESNTVIDAGGKRSPSVSPLPNNDPMYPDVAFENANNKKNIIGVNNQSFLTACAPGTAGYNSCKGEGELQGTGFEGHAGSSWLETRYPVTPGGLYAVRIAIWDSGDAILNSSALLDGVSFYATGGTNVETVIVPDIN